MEQKYLVRRILGAILIISAFIGIGWQIINGRIESCFSKSVFSRTVDDSNRIEEIWSFQDIFVSAKLRAVYLTASGENVVLYGSRYACGDMNIIIINSENGDILRVEPGTILPPNFGINNVAYNDSIVYFGYDGLGQVTRDSTTNAGGVAAYHVPSGTIAWTHTIPGTRSMKSLAASENVIAVDGGGFSSQFYLLDSHTGQVLQTVERGDPLIKNLGFQTNYALWYSYRSSNNEDRNQEHDFPNIALWADNFDGAEQPPILTENAVLIRTNVGTSTGKVRAFDAQTGQLLWETENNVVSNIAAINSTAFFITSSAELVAVEIQSGHKIGGVQFSNRSVQMDDDRGVFVAASGNGIFAYFGDSRQLFAFHFLPEIPTQ